MRWMALSCAVLGLLALPAAAASPDGPLLGLQWQRNTGQVRLAELDPATLEPAGWSLELRERTYESWRRSPDGSLLALGPWDVPRVTIVSLDPPRILREVVLPHNQYAQRLVWVAPHRLLALLGSCCRPGNAVAVIHPGRARIVRSHAISKPVWASAATSDRLVLLLGSGRLGPGKLATAGANGRVRVSALPQTVVGSRPLAGEYQRELRRAGLAVDPGSQRAFVVGADEPVAEVDLRTMRVRYHAVAAARTLQAHTKNSVGPYRIAAWVAGSLAVTGWNGRGKRSDPVGVSLIDTRTWQGRTLSRTAGDFAASGATVAVRSAAGLAVFGLDGGERFAVPGTFGWLQAAAGRVYASRPAGGGIVVDLETAATTQLDARQLPTLLAP